MITKKIALFGTSGPSVWRVAEEALKRGHHLTTIVHDAKEIRTKHFRLSVFSGDIKNQHEVNRFAKGHDVIICLHEPLTDRPKGHIEVNRAIIEGAKSAGIHRIISLGYPVSLKHERSKNFHDKWKPVVEAQSETLKLFMNEDWLRWTYIHSIELAPSQKGGKRFVNDEIFLSNPEGTMKIAHIAQLIDVVLEEAEKTEYILEEDEIII